MPCGPVRVNSACFSMNANASFTAAWWARSITNATAGSATAHRVETDFTGENVKSKPATVCVRGRESFAICPASSDDTIDDLERRPKPGRVLQVALGEIRALPAAGGARPTDADRNRTTLASALWSPGRRQSGRRSRPSRNQSTPPVTRPARCKKTPAQVGAMFCAPGRNRTYDRQIRNSP